MNPLHFAVVVGINCYPGIRNQLTSARQDARAFAAWLRSPAEGGVPTDQVEVITADPAEEARFGNHWDARPVRHEVIRTLARFHAAVRDVDLRDWPRTRLYLYVAGHGVAPPAGRGSLVFADAKPPDFWSDLLDLGQYEQLYERFTPFHEVVLLADCCRETPYGMPVSAEPPFSGRVRGTTRCVLGFATQYGRRAGAPRAGPAADERDGRGFFTAAVLEGLRGRAPHDPHTGIIHSDHLARYVGDRVPELARAHRYEQQGQLLHRGEPINLARATIRQFEVLVRLPPGWTGRVRIIHRAEGHDRVVTDREARGTVRALLPIGIYKVVLAGFGTTLFKVERGETTVEF